jgi:hypothetical protein
MKNEDKKELKNQYINNNFDKRTEEDYKKQFEDTTEEWTYYKTRKSENNNKK